MAQFPLQTTSNVSPLPEIAWSRPATGEFSRRVALAAVLSALIPGLGHLLIGARRKGLILLAATALITVLVIALVPTEPFAVLAMFSQPRHLAVLLVADLILLLFRVYSVVDVVRSSRTPVRHRPGMLAVLALLLAIVAAPHIGIAYYDIITYQFLDEVFDNSSRAPETVAPAQVELTREVHLADGVNAAAPPVVANDGETNASSNP